MRKFVLPLLLLTLGIGACRDDDVTGPTPIEDEEFAAELNVDLSKMTKTGSGLYLQDLVVGNGEVVELGDSVIAHYTGWLANGKEFDSSVGSSARRFRLYHGELIDGWVEGLQGMRVGGTRKLVIPSSLGYGAKGRPNSGIPPHATLVFQVALVGVVKASAEE